MVSGHSTQGTPIPQRGSQVAQGKQQASHKSRYTCTTRAGAVRSRSPLSPLSARHPPRTMREPHKGQNPVQQARMGLSQRPPPCFRILITTKSRRWTWVLECHAEDIKTFMPILHKSGRTAETRCGTDSSGHRAGVEEIREIG